MYLSLVVLSFSTSYSLCARYRFDIARYSLTWCNLTIAVHCDDDLLSPSWWTLLNLWHMLLALPRSFSVLPHFFILRYCGSLIFCCSVNFVSWIGNISGSCSSLILFFSFWLFIPSPSWLFMCGWKVYFSSLRSNILWSSLCQSDISDFRSLFIIFFLFFKQSVNYSCPILLSPR